MAKTAPRAEGIDAELDAARVAWLDDRTAVIGTKSGQLLAATLAVEGGAVRRIRVRRPAAQSPGLTLSWKSTLKKQPLQVPCDGIQLHACGLAVVKTQLGWSALRPESPPTIV